jgi:hypothetical protein
MKSNLNPMTAWAADMKKRLLNQAFDDLSHALRRLFEADYHAHRGGLMFTDRAEAVGNIESALTAVLNAFHSLYDILADEPGAPGKRWFSIGPLALVLAIRNARHHNKANKIRSLYSFHVQEARRVASMEMYVLVDYPRAESAQGAFQLFVSWADLKELLDMPEKQSRVSAKSRQAIEHYLGSANFKAFAESYQEPEKAVVFNIVTVLTDAGIAMMPSISTDLEPLSVESETFASLFETSEPSDRDHPEFICGPFVLPE